MKQEVNQVFSVRLVFNLKKNNLKKSKKSKKKKKGRTNPANALKQSTQKYQQLLRSKLRMNQERRFEGYIVDDDEFLKNRLGDTALLIIIGS